MAWGPWGLRGFSLTARTEEEWKLIQCGVSGCDEFREQRGHYCSVLPPASERRTPRHPEYADASTWNEYNGLYLVRDWGLRGGMQQQGGDTQCSLPHSHHPPLLRARREIIPSCSGVTGTTEGGGRIEPTARATPPPPVRGERRGYAHRASCSGSAPTLFPFPLAGCRVVPTPPPGKKMWGDRRWPICHSWIAARGVQARGTWPWRGGCQARGL